MNTNGAVNFTTTTKQVAQCKVGFDRILVNFGHAQENLNRLVLLFVKQIVKALEILRAKLGIATTPIA